MHGPSRWPDVRPAKRTLVVCALLALWYGTSAAAQTTPPGSVLQGADALLTKFPGTEVKGRADNPKPAAQRTFIDLAAPSVRVFGLAAPGFAWDARLWNAPARLDIPARKVGLVFGVALDDAPQPNAYFTATSIFGLHLVKPDEDGDGLPERIARGQPGARFMAGQWGNVPGAGPGSIYKLDGRTGEITLFANISLNGVPNAGAGLGNIAYDSRHLQLFVSDRETGMIHRLDLNGQELGRFDHGVQGRAAAGLPPVAFDPAGRMDITRGDFDSTDPETWGFAEPKRRVWGLAAHDGRLYYAVARGENTRYPQVWSVALDARTGAFLPETARHEVTLPQDGSRDEVSDLLLTREGMLIAAQRGGQMNENDYSSFARSARARVYRFVPEVPDDPDTPSRWLPKAEKYAIGFRKPHDNTTGGVALGRAYTPQGGLNMKVCEATLWASGEALRNEPSLQKKLRPGGVLPVSGLQGMPVRAITPRNTPPWTSYIIDADGVTDDPRRSGWIGDVEMLNQGCDPLARPWAVADGQGGRPAVNEGGWPAAQPTFTPWNYPEQPGWLYPVELPPLCTFTNGCLGSPENPPKPELDVSKSCNFCQPGEDGKLSCQCTITVKSNGVPFDGALVVGDQLNANGGTIVGLGSSDPWMCAQPAYSQGNPPQCAITYAALSAAGNQSSIDVKVQFDDADAMDKARNCASPAAVGENGEQSTSEQEPACSGFGGVTVEKKFAGDHEACQFGTECSYQITVTNISSTNPYNGPVAIVDNLSGATMVITSVSPQMCNPDPTTAPFACIANVNLAPGASQTFTITGMLTPPSYGPETVEVKNCAASVPPPPDTNGEWWAQYMEQVPGNASCAVTTACAFSCHMSDTSDLTVQKVLKSEDCKPGQQCTYTITMTNNGNAPRSGPFSIVEELPAGATFVSVTPLPWTCAPNNMTPANDVVCKYPPGMPVPAGGSLSFDITVAIPAGFEGDEIRNCAGFDVKRSSANSIVQRLSRLPGMQSIGRMKAQPEAALARYLLGRGMSDAAARAMAKRIMAQANTGDVVTGDGMSCVTTPVADADARKPGAAVPPVVTPKPKKPVKKAVDRPRQQSRPRTQSRPRAPRCDRRTTVRKGNRCVCRFGGARKISRTACACPRGTRLNAKRGRCEKVRVKKPRISCRRPAFPNRAGTRCLCPRGWRPDGRRGCRKVVREQPRVRCVPPARPNKAGSGCLCPRGWRKLTPFMCMPAEPRHEPRPKPRNEHPGKPRDYHPGRP